jgi:hypothetical protein
MRVDQLAPGLWRWTATHPDWTPAEGGEEGWDPEVGCVYCETDDGVLLIDPLVPPDPQEAERFWRALDRDVGRVGGGPTVLLTVYWHARSATVIADRYAGTRVLAPDAGREESEQRTRVTDWFSPGDALPGGVMAFATPFPVEVVLWLPSHAAIVPGDVLLGDRSGGLRLPPDSWLGDEVTREEVKETLRPLLELPIERLLVSHGDPVLSGGRNALARALVA